MGVVIGFEKRPTEADTIAVSLDVTDMIDKAIGFLSKDPEIYQRGSELVRVVRRTPDVMMRSDGERIEREGEPMIVTLTRATLFERLCSRIRWERSSGKGTVKVVQPPESVVRGILDRGQWKGIKPLVSVTSCPTMRPNGTVIQEPGYDTETGIFYAGGVTYPNVPELPTIDDARAALDRIKYVVHQFEFQSDNDRSAWLAALFSVIGRHMVNGCVPAFGFDATTRGAGKSMLAEIIHIIAEGTRAHAMSMPVNEEEWRKNIMTIATSGRQIVFLDNVSRKISSASLDSALTSTHWMDRKLGTQLVTSAPLRAVWLITGNNLRLGGDLSRRMILVRLESKHENPESRTDFKIKNILGYVQANRTRLVTDVLTILRAASLSTDRPAGATWGSYDHWSMTIPPVLEWLGEPSPMAKRATETEEGDEDRQHLIPILTALLSTPEGLTARDLVEAAYYDPQHAPAGMRRPPQPILDLKPILEEITNCTAPRKPDHIKLGVWFRRYRGRVVGEMRLVRTLDRTSTAVWSSQAMTPPQTIPPPNQESTTYENCWRYPPSAPPADESQQLPIVE